MYRLLNDIYANKKSKFFTHKSSMKDHIDQGWMENIPLYAILE